MGIFDRLFGRTRAATPGDGGGLSLGDGVLAASSINRGPPRRGTRELLVAYREQPWLRAVTSRIARGVANAGWKVYVRAEAPVRERDGTTFVTRHTPRGRVGDIGVAPTWRWGVDRAVRDLELDSPDFDRRARRRMQLAEAGLLREAPDHPLLDLLYRPNDELTGRSCLHVTQVWLDIKGEGFWLLKRGDGGKPEGFIPIPPHWVQQVPRRDTPWFRVSWNALQMNVPAGDMVWFRDPDPENPYARGAGVAESLGDELETDEYAAKYLKAWFYNSAMPSFLVSYEGAQAADVKRAQEKFEQEHRGYFNAHRAHFSNGKMNAVRLDSSFRDQQISELRRMERDTVVQVFGVPPEVIGIIENSNRATIQGARYIYVLGVEFPRVEFLRSELQHQLMPLFDERAVLEMEVPIPDDEQRRLDVMRAQPAAFSLNEWRAEAGYTPLPQFDEVFPALLMPGQQPGTEDEEGEEEDEGETPAEGADAAEDLSEGENEKVEEDAKRSDPPWASAPLVHP